MRYFFSLCLCFFGVSVALAFQSPKKEIRNLDDVLQSDFAKNFGIHLSKRKHLENKYSIVHCKANEFKEHADLLILTDSLGAIIQADLVVSRLWAVHNGTLARSYIRAYLQNFNTDSALQQVAAPLLTKLWRTDRAELSTELDAVYQAIMGRVPSAALQNQQYSLLVINGKPDHTIKEQLTISLGRTHADPRWEILETPNEDFLTNDFLLKEYGLEPHLQTSVKREWRNKSKEATLSLVTEVCHTFRNKQQARRYHRDKLHENMENAEALNHQYKIGKELQIFRKNAKNDPDMKEWGIEHHYYYFMFYHRNQAFKLFMVGSLDFELQQAYIIAKQAFRQIKRNKTDTI